MLFLFLIGWQRKVAFQRAAAMTPSGFSRRVVPERASRAEPRHCVADCFYSPARIPQLLNKPDTELCCRRRNSTGPMKCTMSYRAPLKCSSENHFVQAVRRGASEDFDLNELRVDGGVGRGA